MKNLVRMSLLSLGLLFFGCNLESIEQSDIQINNQEKSTKKNKDFEVVQTDNSTNETTASYCHEVNLIAGQHHEIGTVSINIEGDFLIVTYTTTGDWVLDATHLHISNCEEDGFPTTGANNPKIGHFDYASEHEDGTTQVTYAIDIGEITGTLCFAAHAEVDGPSGETAWAEGEDFGGNSWAMYFEANLIDCGDEDDDDGGGPPAH